MKKLFLVAISLLPLSSFSQLLRNASFENMAKDRYLKYWVVEPAGNNGSVHADSSTAHLGKYSIKVSLQHSSGADTLAYAFNTINTSRLPPIKRIVVKAWVKLDRLTDPDAFILLNDEDRRLTSRSFANRHTKDWGKWQQLFLFKELDRPQKIYQINIAACVRKGRAWFDDFSVSVDGVDISKKGKTTFSNQNRQWITHHLISAVQQGDIFFSKLDKIIGDRYLLGVGEPTHGTKEAYAFKIELFKNLVLQHHYRIIALENGMAETYKINQYINADPSGTWTRKDLKKYLNSFLCTSELLDLIEWMRSYNQIHNDKISCIGMDVQTYEQCLLNIKDLLREIGQASYINRVEEIDCAIHNLVSQRFDDTEQRQTILKMVDILSSSCQTDLAQYARQSDSMMWLVQHFELLRDYLLEDKARWDSYSRRTQFMYDNLLWFFKNQKIEKTLIWAHNGHINKLDGAQSVFQRQESLGRLLKAGFGDDYYCIGIYTGSGTYSALRSETDSRLQIFPLEDPGNTTVEHFLSLVKPCAYFLDLSGASRSEMPAFLTQEMLQRACGMFYNQNQFYDIGAVSELYDGIYFIQKSTNTNRIKN